MALARGLPCAPLSSQVLRGTHVQLGLPPALRCRRTVSARRSWRRAAAMAACACGMCASATHPSLRLSRQTPAALGGCGVRANARMRRCFCHCSRVRHCLPGRPRGRTHVPAAPSHTHKGTPPCRDCWCVAIGNSHNDEERCVLAGFDNGDVKMFDLRANKACVPDRDNVACPCSRQRCRANLTWRRARPARVHACAHAAAMGDQRVQRCVRSII